MTPRGMQREAIVRRNRAPNTHLLFLAQSVVTAAVRVEIPLENGIVTLLSFFAF